MTESEKLYMTFDEMKLRDDLLRGIYAAGFERPSVIQQRAIIPMINGGDIIAQAQSGTGKTGTFVIGMLQKLDLTTEKPVCQAIILSPNRELAEQTYNVTRTLSGFLGSKILLCVGGKPIKENLDVLKKGVHAVIGTPGRVHDMINRGMIDGSKISMLIIDEADMMLDRGFKEQLYYILRAVDDGDKVKGLQISLFSATLPDEILEITNKFMQNPTKILIKKDQVALEGIKQYFIDVDKEEGKLDTFLDIYGIITINQCIVYCNSKSKVDWLNNELKKREFPVSAIHGEMKTEEREAIMDSFRTGGAKLLLTTDLLARGIDVQGVNLVINFDLPTNREMYIHRIGRTGRYGRKGTSINFLTSNDSKYRTDIEEYYDIKMVEMPSPDSIKF
jgi:translation initiation factor 4A